MKVAPPVSEANVVSMVDGAMFDKLEALGRLLRKDERPFGGIQLVITGDFFQLPPVPDSGQKPDLPLKRSLGLDASLTPSNSTVSSVKKIRSSFTVAHKIDK